MASLPSLRRVPATLEAVGALVEWIGACSREVGIPEPRAAGLEVAVEEALVNVCSHAYPPPSSGAVRVRASVSTSGFTVEIWDEGVPFDPLAAAAPDVLAPLEERPNGGLGIHFLKRFTDEVTYRRAGEENLLTLTVRL